jgi:branched-subunit amino acid transport protein AzlD
MQDNDPNLNEPRADAENPVPQKTGSFPALLRTVRELEISLQNILTVISVFVIPFLAYVLGMPLVLALSLGLSLVVWFTQSSILALGLGTLEYLARTVSPEGSSQSVFSISIRFLGW